MSYSSDISGLELFQMPFSHHSAVQSVPSGQDNVKRQQTVMAQTKAPQQQSGRQDTIQQTRIQNPAAQDVESVAFTEKKPDITHGNAAVNECIRPDVRAKDVGHVPSGKVQADVPEKQPAPASDQKGQPETETAEQPAPAETQEQTETKPKELVLDMSSGTAAVGSDKSGNADDAAKRKAHEATEAKRKAEWDARQQAKKQKEDEALQKIKLMSDADIIAASTQRISTDVERITRRNMKECVSDHIQDLCRKDPAFARLTLHPRKNMINCFKYINRKAKEFIQQEMADNNIKPENGIYGSDVPDGIVLGWAEDYMRDADAPEDAEKEEKFVPKPYSGAAAKAKKTAPKAKKTEKPAGKAQKQEQSENYEQMTLGV